MAGPHRPYRGTWRAGIVVSEARIRGSGTPVDQAATVWPDWRAVVAARDLGPDVAVLHESAELKVVLVALAANQRPPAHPGPAASFHVLSGTGAVVIGEVEHPVSAGATVVAASGTRRSVLATSPLVFLGNLGDPASEDGPR